MGRFAALTVNDGPGGGELHSGRTHQPGQAGGPILGPRAWVRPRPGLTIGEEWLHTAGLDDMMKTPPIAQTL